MCAILNITINCFLFWRSIQVFYKHFHNLPTQQYNNSIPVRKTRNEIHNIRFSCDHYRKAKMLLWHTFWSNESWIMMQKMTNEWTRIVYLMLLVAPAWVVVSYSRVERWSCSFVFLRKDGKYFIVLRTPQKSVIF